VDLSSLFNKSENNCAAGANLSTIHISKDSGDTSYKEDSREERKEGSSHNNIILIYDKDSDY
jgi:hypothetical protein